MKMLTLAILLLSFPLLSNARDGRYYDHDYHGQDDSHFWKMVEKRQHKQHRRIDRGIEHGQLTPREVKRLERRQQCLADEIRHLRHHDYINYSNRRRIVDQLDHVSRKIHKLKHNRRNVHYVNNHHFDRYYKRQPEYRNNRDLSLAENNYSAGLYFRF